MANDKDKRHNVKQIDFSAKSLGKIKRGQQKSQNNGDEIIPKKKQAAKIKPQNDRKQRPNKPANNAKARAAADIRRNDGYGDGIGKDALSVVEGGRSFKRMATKAVIGALCAAVVLGGVIFCATRPTGIGEWLKTAFTSGENAHGYPVGVDERKG